MSLSSASASVIGASGSLCWAKAEYLAKSTSSSSFSGVAIAVLSDLDETEILPKVVLCTSPIESTMQLMFWSA